MFRRQFFIGALLVFAAVAAVAVFWPPILLTLVVLVPVFLLGLQDALQDRRAVLKNWPLIGRFRYIFEAIRPEIQQYFVESNTDGKPVNRELRSVVYQRAKGELDTLPFGTQRDVYAVGYEWMAHSIAAGKVEGPPPRVTIGGPDCTQPYASSYLNVGAMSYGSLSSHAVLALNAGAKAGGFAHNTGEGGISPYHLEPGGDLVFQFGTGYFGCRASDGGFSEERFVETVSHPTVKMVEIKLSQGAKPGHGGILPARKVTPEIAKIRGVPVGKQVDSPPAHRTFSTPVGLLEFVARVRELAGGRPVGFKLCVGRPAEFLAICKAMRETGITPDFIAVDGGEGGTGAAPLEFSNRVGAPMREGLTFVRDALVGTELRERIKVMASGKVLSGFDMVRAVAMGADLCVSARAMMFALGCIQARRCNSNDCPVGVATQKQALVVGLDVEDKTARVARYHEEAVQAFRELVAAAGLDSPTEITPHHVRRRIDNVHARHYGEIYPPLAPGQLLAQPDSTPYAAAWKVASPDSFRPLVRA